MTHSIIVSGAVPTAQPEITDMSDSINGKFFSIICTPMFQNGKLVAIDFPVEEYYWQRSERNGKVLYSYVSRHVNDKALYPNWPNPEPEA